MDLTFARSTWSRLFESPRVWSAFFAVCLSGLSWGFQSRLGFVLNDEGYLWYGVQRVLAGEVPIRDFMAYDPGRYYFSAFFMGLAGDSGLVALRATLAAVQAIGLYLGLMLLQGSLLKTGRRFLGLSAFVLSSWMFVSYKQYDITFSIALVSALALMASRPDRRSFFIGGLVIGLSAVFGRNHGFYGLAGCLCLLLYLAARARKEAQPLRVGACLPALLAGILLGFSPVLAMFVWVPGFAPAFAESIRFLFEVGATNLSLPVPWPWAVRLAGVSPGTALQNLAYGSCFVALIAFSLGGWGWLALRVQQAKPVSSGLVAAILMTPAYAHYVFSRPDGDHLSFGIFPLLLGLLMLSAGTRAAIKWPSLVFLAIFSLGVTYHRHPLFEVCKPDVPEGDCVPIQVRQDQIRMARQPAQILRLLKAHVDATPPDRYVFLAPYWPGAYAALGKRSPIWEIYALFPRSEAFQNAEIERLKRAQPGLVALSLFALDGRPELAYNNTHRLIFRYVTENFRLVARLGTVYLFRPPELLDAREASPSMGSPNVVP